MSLFLIVVNQSLSPSLSFSPSLLLVRFLWRTQTTTGTPYCWVGEKRWRVLEHVGGLGWEKKKKNYELRALVPEEVIAALESVRQQETLEKTAYCFKPVLI